MSVSRRLALYVLALGAVFAATLGVGRAAGPIGLANAEADADHGAMGASASAGGAGLPGLAVAEGGFRLVPATDIAALGTVRYQFRIVDAEGVVSDFEVEHEKPMHVIVVRRDLTPFDHLHPTMDGEGTWTVDLDLELPGPYRVFADFVVDGEQHTLGTDLLVAGDFRPHPLPAPATTVDAGDGYAVELHDVVVAGDESALRFTVRRHGAVVEDLEPYLGAAGHLVALRAGDLAYLHVHAEQHDLAFEADFPTPGPYRLFLQFQHGGRVRTAAFTVDAEEA